MSATTEPRNTKRRNADQLSPLVDVGVTVYAGTLICLLTATGEAVSGGTVSTGRCVGVAEETVTGDGVKRVPLRTGCFQFANSTSGDLIAAGDIGNVCYVADNQTVAKTDGSATRQVAGAIFDVDSAGVWVLIGPGAVGPQGPEGA